MKKHLFFLAVFLLTFSFPASATVSYSDEQDASNNGYNDGIYDAYDYFSSDLTESEADLYLQNIDPLCQYFLENNPFDPEETDPEKMQQAYDYGYNLGYRDYILIEKVIMHSRETIHEQGRVDGSLEQYTKVTEDLGYLTPEGIQQDIDQAYSDGYRDGCESITESLPFKAGSLVIFLCVCFILWAIYNAISKKLSSK